MFEDGFQVITDVAVLSFEPRELHHWFVTSELYKCLSAMMSWPLFPPVARLFGHGLHSKPLGAGARQAPRLVAIGGVQVSRWRYRPWCG